MFEALGVVNPWGFCINLISIINRIRTKISSNLKNKHFSEVLKGGSLSFITKILGTFLGLLTNLIITRYYGVEVLGSLSIIISIVTIASIFSLMGTDVSILRFVPPFVKEKDSSEVSNIIKRIFLFVFTTSIVLSLILYVSTDYILAKFFEKQELHDYVVLASCLLVFVVFTNLSSAAIRSLKNINLFVFISFLPAIVNLVTIAFLTYFFFNISNPVYSYFSTKLIVCLLSIFLLRKHLFNFNSEVKKTSLKKILNTSFPMFLTAVMQLVILQTDIIMLGSLSTIEQVGIYAIVMKLAVLSGFILQSLNSIVAPKFSELFYSREHQELLNLSKKTTKLVFFATVPISIALIVFGESLLSFFGEAFKPGYLALLILTIGQLTNAISGPVGYFLNMTGHQKQFNYIVFLSAFINIILNYFLIPIYGVTGAAFASMLSMVLWNVIATIYTYKKLNFTIMYIPFLKYENKQAR